MQTGIVRKQMLDLGGGVLDVCWICMGSRIQEARQAIQGSMPIYKKMVELFNEIVAIIKSAKTDMKGLKAITLPGPYCILRALPSPP